MSARDKIAGLFPGKPHLGLRVADEILDEHARELAAAIRKKVEEDDAWRPKWQVGMHDAADLIDPDEES